MMKSRGGFTLVEILIVVVILGILAAIVVPQFTEASGEAKESRLMQDLQSVRSQIELYKLQHAGALPGSVEGVDFTTALTSMTNSAGVVQSAPGVGVYGPYLQKMPSNPYIVEAEGVTQNGIDTTTLGGGTQGWFFNTSTGAFNADDADHTTW